MDPTTIASMTVAALRKELRGKGQDARGNKAKLVARLTAILTSEAPNSVPDQLKAPAPENPAPENAAPQVAEEEPIEAYEEIEEEPTSTVEPVEHIAQQSSVAAEGNDPEPTQEQPSEDILSEEKMKKRALRFGLPWPPPPEEPVKKESVVKSVPTKPVKKGKRARDVGVNDVDESPKKKLATGKKGKKQTQNRNATDDDHKVNGQNRRGNGRQLWEEDRAGNRAGREDRISNRVGRDDRVGNRHAREEHGRGIENYNVNRRDSGRRDGTTRRDRDSRRSPETQRDVRANGGVRKRAKNVKQPKNGGKAAVPAPVKNVELSKEELAKREARAKRFGQSPKSVS